MNFKKILVSSLLLAGIAVSPHALAEQSFDGHTINVAFEKWYYNDVSSLLEITSEKDVLASDSTYPDEKDFSVYSSNIDHAAWDIDFNQNVIELTYTSIGSNDLVKGYQYIFPRIFHFQDKENSLPEIINVTVNDTFAPLGFDLRLVTFDANNIYVNLKGSVCLTDRMKPHSGGGLMPSCTNPSSPTGYWNRISLKVEFAAKATIDETPIDEKPIDMTPIDRVAINMTPIDEPAIDTCPAIDEPTIDEPVNDVVIIDELYVWAESKFPEYFPSHQESTNIVWQYARFYPESGVYIGSLEGRIYAFKPKLGIFLDLGELGDWAEGAANKETLDELYVWAESTYPEFFPEHQESTDIVWQYARFYPETGVYIAALEGRIYAFKPKLGTFLDLGELGDWVARMETEKREMDKK